MKKGEKPVEQKGSESEVEPKAEQLNVGLEAVALFANKILVEIDGRMAEVLVDVMNTCFEECNIPLEAHQNYEVWPIEEEGR